MENLPDLMRNPASMGTNIGKNGAKINIQVS